MTSAHVNDRDDSFRIDSGNKTSMNTLSAMDGITVADTMTIDTMTAGITTMSGSSGINVASTAIPTSTAVRP